MENSHTATSVLREGSFHPVVVLEELSWLEAHLYIPGGSPDALPASAQGHLFSVYDAIDRLAIRFDEMYYFLTLYIKKSYKLD